MNNVLRFPTKPKRPPLDWNRIEEVRQEKFKKISKKALHILRLIVEARAGFSKAQVEYFARIDSEDPSYPPENIRLAPHFGDMIWILDLFDRYGGELRFGKEKSIIRRTKKRPAVFILQEVSKETIDGFHLCFDHFYEHFIQSKYWRLLGKEIKEVELMIFIIEKGDKRFLGIFDKGTASIIFQRFDEGMPFTELFNMAGIKL